MHLFTYYNMRHLVLTWDENSTTFSKMYIFISEYYELKFLLHLNLILKLFNF